MWEAIGSVGKALGGLGSAYGAIQQAKLGKKLYNMQKDQYNRGVQKENQAQANLDAAIDSVYGTKKKKEENTVPQFNLGA